MNIDDFIINAEKGYEKDERENTYEEYKVEENFDETYAFTSVKLEDVWEQPNKISKNTGNTYNSNKIILKLFNDEEKFYFKMYEDLFDNWKPEKGIAIVHEPTILARICKFFNGEEKYNRYTINYSELQDLLKYVNSITVKFDLYSSGKFDNPTFDILDVKFEEE